MSADVSRIYKDKYMQTNESDAGKKSIDVTSIAPNEKEERSRSKSIWTRSKKDKA